MPVCVVELPTPSGWGGWSGARSCQTHVVQCANRNADAVARCTVITVDKEEISGRPLSRTEKNRFMHEPFTCLWPAACSLWPSRFRAGIASEHSTDSAVQLAWRGSYRCLLGQHIVSGGQDAGLASWINTCWHQVCQIWITKVTLTSTLAYKCHCGK